MGVIFEYPYIIITIIVFCFIILGAAGAYFALLGIKETKKGEKADFLSVTSLEKEFSKAGKMRKKRFTMYVSVMLDNARSLYSDSKAARIFDEIKPVLLKNFYSEENGGIAIYDRKNFIAAGSVSREEVIKSIEKSLAEINKILTAHNAISVVDIKFGFFYTYATQIDFDEAITRARQACSLAEKENIPYAEWNNKGGRALEKRIERENNIENEIENNRFFLEYQPVIDASTKKIVGAEVLSRLNSEKDGVLAPGSFLSAVSSVGISDKFDYYIFEKNCKWISNNKELREKYFYTVNFSRATLCEPSFTDNIIRIVDKYGLKYSSMAIEVLEDKEAGESARKQMIANLSLLKEKGFLILLDDFGSGYTTFGDLQTFSIDEVKIDKSVLRSAETESGYLVLKNIVRTAKELGYKTVCEGVETKEQEEIAISAGCDLLQGYYYYRPMPVAQLEVLFEKNDL